MIKTANLTGSVSRNAGGMFDCVRRLVQCLMQTGLEVSICGVADEFTSEDIAAWAPVPVKAFRPSWPEAFGYSPDFLNDLETFAPDLTHTHGVWMYPSVATNRYSRIRKKPYVISPQGMLDSWAMHNARWKKVMAYVLYESAHLHGAACLRAVCHSEARALRQVGIKCPIAVIPNGIDLPEMTQTQTQEQCAPWQGLVSERRKVLLFLGRIHPKKGLPNLLRAWSRTRHPDWVLAIAGWEQGGHEEKMKRLARELDLALADVRPDAHPPPHSNAIKEASVVFLGPQFGENKAACYRCCDAFVLPSFSEGLPMAVLEAWSYGKAVLITPECNLPEGFACGAALQMGTDVESIAGALRDLFAASSASLSTLGGNGYKLVADRFAWPCVAADMKQLYEWILGSGAKPGFVNS